MINENNNVLSDEDIINILTLVKEKVNELDDEKIYYSGKKNYFSAGKIKEKKVHFVFAYTKKTSELGFMAESSNEEGVSLLKEVLKENKQIIENEVGLEFSLDKGIKNKNCYRIVTKIFLDESRGTTKQIDDFVRAFMKFKAILIKLANVNKLEENYNVLDYNSKINISESQWKEIILDSTIFTKKDVNLMLLIYIMGGKATAKELSIIENTHPTSYNALVVSLSKRILKKLNMYPEIRSNGKARYWSVPFLGQELPGNSFQWILRKNLYNALKNLILENKLDITLVKNKYERGKRNLKKIKSDSWVDNLNVNGENFLGRKTVDYSMLNSGTTIPIRYHKNFIDNLSKEPTLGESVKIKVIVNNKEYKCAIDRPNTKNRKSVTFRFLNRDKALKELLQNKFETSYNYTIQYKGENGKTPNSIPERYEEFIDFYKGNEKDIFIMKLIPKGSKISLEGDIEEENINEDNIEDEVENFYDYRNIKNKVEELKYIHNYILSKGFNYSEDLIKNFYISLKTKPFVILSGISGTGKSKIVELFAEAIGATYKNGRFNLVPVKPDWSDSTDLLGYRNIEGKFTPGIITTVAYEAMKNPELPYFICLDEMNLARVEYYFSDILSLMETRRLDEEGNIITNNILGKEQFGRDERSKDSYGDVYIPQNLYIVGTVNMDETTFPFSKKVLDRANTIEFNKVNLEFSFNDVILEGVEKRVYKNDLLLAEYLKLSECKEEKDLVLNVINELIKINDILKEYNQHFGFRVRDEIVFYMIYATNDKDNIMDYYKALDYCITQKILPKINGSNSDVLEILIRIYNLLNETNYDYTSYIEDEEIKDIINKSNISKFKKSSEKLSLMIRRFVRDGFTTFWQ